LCLVTIILALLVAILLPVFMKIHDGTYHPRCISHEKEIGLARIIHERLRMSYASLLLA
jgi:hypothetical protein